MSFNLIDRRRFIQTAAALGAGAWAVPSLGWSPYKRWKIEKVQFACIGVGGKGHSDSNDADRLGRVVAICDIDENNLSEAASRFPDARKFFDFRELFEVMGDEIDAVTVSTPDHTHAPAAVRAMRLGKHCFCQKPLTHTLSESRLLAETARKHNVQTLMGNQGTASGTLRKAASIVKSGALGPVKEVHVWTNRPVWPQGCDRPPVRETPAHVNWNMWIGPAPMRPDGLWPEQRGWGPRDAYHPFNWRGWWDFGTGALGDMACHTMNLPFMALDLRDPVSVQAKTSGHNRDSYPAWSKIRYEFAARGNRPAVNMTWYDGGQTPDSSIFNGEPLAESGSVIVCEAGSLYSPGDNGGEFRLVGNVDEPADIEFDPSPGHFEEFIRAIETGGTKKAVSNFPDYAGPLTETALLGNLAVWADGFKVNWNAKNQTATIEPASDSPAITLYPDVEKLIRKEYRDGWEV